MTQNELNEWKGIRNRIDRLITNAVGDTSPVEDAPQKVPDAQGRPFDPTAKSLSDLVTPKQLGLMRHFAFEADLSLEDECETKMGCSTDTLSKKHASEFIDHLKAAAQPQRRSA
jgi:hypothetical protein